MMRPVRGGGYARGPRGRRWDAAFHRRTQEDAREPRRARATAILVGAVVALAACGKGSGDEDELSRTALPPKANPICAKAVKELTAVRQPIGFTSPTQAGTYFRAVQRIRGRAAGELSKLKPDDDVKADYDAYLAAQREELNLVAT